MPKKACLKAGSIVLLLVDCAGHYGNDLAASVFFNVCIVSKSPAELCPPIRAFMESRCGTLICFCIPSLSLSLCLTLTLKCVQLQNQSELRAYSAERAAFFLDAALAARSTSRSDCKEEDRRNSHILFTLHISQYRIEKSTKAGSMSNCAHFHIYSGKPYRKVIFLWHTIFYIWLFVF